MKIKFSCAGSGGLYCVDDDTYDGAVGSGPQAIGHGFSRYDAFRVEQLEGLHIKCPDCGETVPLEEYDVDRCVECSQKVNDRS